MNHEAALSEPDEQDVDLAGDPIYEPNVEDRLFVASGCETDDEYEHMALWAFEAYELHCALTGSTERKRTWSSIPSYVRLKWIRVAQFVHTCADINWGSSKYLDLRYESLEHLDGCKPENAEETISILRDRFWKMQYQDLSWNTIAKNIWALVAGNPWASFGQPTRDELLPYEAIARNIINRFECEKIGQRYEEIKHDWLAWVAARKTS